ncbi:MAG: [FeFe] hydrogenase H-cluster maturation GTPase HydF [Candidatus Omnitrophica bacterium]|nr:[FeFe] hydrogenase H-cluster maturation GTPase HydF [Candidatus Omnitrophota bacterium]
MLNTPKSLRLQIGLFGRTNVGKSSFLNMVAGQDVAITSPFAGTTTDVVEKTMEILPLGPVVILDTAGLDDHSVLGEARREKTGNALTRCDILVLVTEADSWGDTEIQFCKEVKKPLIIVVNKCDQTKPSDSFLEMLNKQVKAVVVISSVDPVRRLEYINDFKAALVRMVPDDCLHPATLVGDLLPAGGLAVLVVPIDLQAPKGRLILPQVQTIRDILDNDATVAIVKEREYAAFLKQLNRLPDLVVCDSQVVMKMVADTPLGVPCTTFSILMARLKGDLIEFARGAAVIEHLQVNDKVLIAESCSHHALEDDIGRVKIPRWIRQYLGVDLQFDVLSGRDYPKNLKDYQLIIHCGACMLTRGEMLSRLYQARQSQVPVSNYGLVISVVQGVIHRVLSPFPAALNAYIKEYDSIRGGGLYVR